MAIAAWSSAARNTGSAVARASTNAIGDARSSERSQPSKRSVIARSAASPPARTSARIARAASRGSSSAGGAGSAAATSATPRRSSLVSTVWLMVTVTIRDARGDPEHDLPDGRHPVRLSSMVQSDIAELSTIGAQLDDLAKRVVALGDRYRDSPDSAVANDVDLAERSLIAASRAIARAGRTLQESA